MGADLMWCLLCRDVHQMGDLLGELSVAMPKRLKSFKDTAHTVSQAGSSHHPPTHPPSTARRLCSCTFSFPTEPTSCVGLEG